MNTPPGVLVTRPSNQNKVLCGLLAAAHCQPLVLPTLQITPVAPPARQQLAQQLANRPAPGWIIFVSANAVAHGWPLIQSQPAIIEQSRFAAIGRATATALQARGVAVTAMPATEFNSDGLLALAEFSAPIYANILIIRGRGGRAYLGDQLTERGAQVDYAECYHRELPTASGPQLGQWLGDQAIDLVTITSRAALQNLFTLCPAEFQEQLKKVTYVLLSPALEQTATILGITGTLLVATEASDQGLCATISQLMILKDETNDDR